ncbi:MAG: PQQ-binding-like beta-propeller repeat protein [Gammaproteobacteria bacterium]
MTGEVMPMKRPTSSCLIRTPMDLRCVLVALAALLLAACGGGGGSSSNQSSNSNVWMTVSPLNVSVSATTTQQAPSYGVQVNVTGLTSGQTAYLGAQPNGQGISSIDNPGGTSPVFLTINFDSPASLGAGTYKASVKVEVCFDQNCTQQAGNSPQNVNITYTVTKSNFAVNGLSPTSAYVGAQSFTLTVNGSDFSSQSAVLWNGTQLQTSYVNSSQLTAQVPASDIATTGSASVSVSDPTNGNSNTITFSVNPSPLVITSLSPSNINAGSPSFTLTVIGTSFASQSVIIWNGSAQTTNFQSATQLTAQIPASDIATPGTATVSVTDPVYGTSNTQSFTVNTPPLALNTVSPMSVTVGGPGFTLTALGTSFTGTSTVEWNGTSLTTTLVSSTELLAQVPASDISTTGTASVIVSDPNSPPGTTGAQTVSIAPPSIDAASFQINAANTGDVNFSSVSFPSNPTWSVNVGGTPSYAIIVDGEVIVTVQLSNNNSEILALDQSTGSTVWGPISISGNANAAYANGRLFVLESTIGNSPTLEALDVNTGAVDWSTILTGQYWFSGAPTAANGMVYVGGAGSGGTLYGVDQTTGSIEWTQYVQNGDNSTPAVTADGVYVTYPCQTYDIRPATGELIWNNNTGCEGGGGNTPVVANQLDYSPNNFPSYSGDVFNAETGASDGTYAADSPPAFTNTMGYFLKSGTLSGILLSNDTLQWSFNGDGNLVGSPIAVNQYVFIGSSSGNLYALDGNTGAQVWNVNVGAPIDSSVLELPFTGLAAGDGLLVVPAGTTVTAYTLSTNP